MEHAVDNTQLSAFRPIFNQKGGSCAQASSVGYVFTYEINTLRGLASNTLVNQYPYDFTYNFTNSGSGSNGSMPNQGFEIGQKLGIPNADVYGGFGLGEHDRWVSGYEVYYNGMQNRAASQFTINVSTENGINEMREWLDNHGAGDDKGGCMAFCYNSSGCQTISLASGTPEAGKKAIVEFGSSGGHAVSIAGYNDSVRYDYNGDGQYTNNVDLNGDRVIGVEDWEIGAVLMVNSWGTSFGNSGKIWVMYRMCADGMWSTKVYAMRTREEIVQPQLTFKTTIDHNQRNQIRLKAGVSNDLNATEPDETISWGKAFNYSGGSYPMCGESGPSEIEIGLDATLLLDEITGNQAKLFLQVDSKGGTGQVKKFSVIDYSGGSPVETVCDQTNVSISGTTYLSVLFSGQPGIKILSPNGGEKWEQSSPQTIAWSDNIDDNVKIELYKGGAVKETISDNTESDGSFEWVVPGTLEPGNDYSIKITCVVDPSLIDESDAQFFIEEEYIISTFPHIEPFEDLDPGKVVLPTKWEQLADDDFEWLVLSGPTPSKEYGSTGPDGDHTDGNGNYIYIEASDPNNPEKKASFVTPKFDISSLDDPELSFWCHMFSDSNTMGDLYLDIYVDGTWKNDLLHLTDDHGDAWFEVKQDLTDYVGKRVIFRFRGITGETWCSDICIDDFKVASAPITPIVFELGVPSAYNAVNFGSRIYFQVPGGVDKTTVTLSLYSISGQR